MIKYLATLTLLFFVFVIPSFSRADVHLPAIFGDHMVLQQDVKIPVWGTADAGEAITVTLGDQTSKTTADASGKWRIDLNSVASTTPLTMTVTGKNTLTFNDVLMGDVWVCSGQSNMEFPFHAEYNYTEEAKKPIDEQMRFFKVTHKVAIEPQDNVQGKWLVGSKDKEIVTFSAVGFFFARELSQHLNRPIGMIGSHWSGMPAQAFTSLSGLQKDPPFTNYIDAFQKDLADYSKAKEDYPAQLADYQQKLKEWNETVGPAYDAERKKWQDANTEAQQKGLPSPPSPTPPSPTPKPPNVPEGAPNTPTVLFNGMIAPLIPYAIKGVIWYQGESNGGLEYRTLFPRMITDWREKWGEGDFPFLFVQLAKFQPPQVAPAERNGFALTREAQLMTLSLPSTGMAVTIDIGDANTVHPKDKYDVGLRLSLAARHIAYGEDLVYSGPIYDSMKVEGNTIRISFKNIGSGLILGTPPWTPNGVPIPEPTELKGFSIAGVDKKWFWANAKIDNNDVVVSSNEVPSPVAVRYGFTGNPPCNLYNKENLPASPFRTDDWNDLPLPMSPSLPTNAAPISNEAPSSNNAPVPSP
jgi:sialate O-acetylesterase